jgi:hypothetical protein
MDLDFPAPSQASSVDNRVYPDDIGLSLEPHGWADQSCIRPPQLRASLLLGWHCATCGRLNPRIKWTHQALCPPCKVSTISPGRIYPARAFCQTTVEFVLPEWHRKAHTEAVGPIGTLYRLDDGGHQPKTGLHKLAARDIENGLTCVEYWLAEPPMPILAELNRDPSTSRRQSGRQKAHPRQSEAPPPPIPSSCTLMAGTAAASNRTPAPLARVSECSRHPDGGPLRRPRDAAGSRAVFSENTRMLFVHITCPQHPASLELVDSIFSAFARQVPMERQINSSSYRTGKYT